MSQLVVGNYLLGELLGRGGMSDVYAARHRFLGDSVAVKLVRADAGGADPAVADALIAEAASMRAIAHPNVVRVLDVGRDPDSGRCYLVMERVDGESLAARMRVGRLDEAEVRRLGAAIADGAAAAHAAGLVHRDLKPANVMLCGDEPKLVDFGVARHLGDRAAVTTSRRVGTAAYMAPEQFTGGLIAPCVDIWALGVILFEAATGRLPFDGFDDGRCPQLFEPAPRAAVSPALDALIARCLARSPGDRPASMIELARDLRAAPDERITCDLGPVSNPVAVAVPASVGVPASVAVPAAGSSVRATARWPIVAALAALTAVVAIAALLLGSPDPPSAPAAALPTSPSPSPSPASPSPSPSRATASPSRASPSPPAPSPPRLTPAPASSASEPHARPSARPRPAHPPQGEGLD